jgi:hypothetical protein
MKLKAGQMYVPKPMTGRFLYFKSQKFLFT